jgi:multiple sugar transport system substrate-binding protein
VKADYPDLLWAIPNINGHQYGVPYAADPRLFFYNKEIFDQAGIPYPTEAWTWDYFMGLAKKLTDKNHFGFVLPSTYAGRGYLDYFTWMWNNGANVLNKDMTQATVNTPEAVEALEFVDATVRIIAGGVLTPQASTYAAPGKPAPVSGRAMLVDRTV